MLSLCSEKSEGQNLYPAPIRGIKIHSIKSAFNHKTYQLGVLLPKNYSEQDTLHYPVLYVLDGKFSFNGMGSIRDVMDLGKEIKDIIIVSIEDSCTTDADWLASRNNDFTPSSMPQVDTLTSKIMNIPEGKLKSGGAELFLNTLQNDMIPFIEKHYKTTNDRGLSGHSLGGLFAGYCLLKKPGLFKRYGINSPSFWWNNSEMVRIENDYASHHSELTAKVFFSVGGFEDANMIASFNAFTNAMKSHDYKGLSATVKIFDGETHLSVVPACSSRTLKVLYGTNVK
ncbi:alpha/beta hydrolase [Mucilaginibacter lappiensis]|uniref:alpha/beta hydrolase n=1 Tax=Mucilaginibacter lappiensis TaxID=354630 RepID=UPI003D1DFBA7